MTQYRAKLIRNIYAYILSALVLSPFILSASSAQDFTAKTIGDYGNVTVMEVMGNYDSDNPDGSTNHNPRAAIAKEFFHTHQDEYDFLVIFSNFDFKMPEAEAKAFYLGVKNDTHGIGAQLFDNTAFFGSKGKLQGMIDMGNISNLVTDPRDSKYENTLSTLSHEVLHRWAARVKFRDTAGAVSTSLLGKNGEHWNFLLNTYASLLYGNQWKDNGDGTFTSIAVTKYYSPLDLYLMGFIDKSQVPPMFLIDNSAIDPARMPEVGATISGRLRYITIDDIIAAEGDRIPSSLESQKTFKTAFIFITSPGTFTGDEVYGIENIRNGWITRFSVLTDGKGIMEVASTLQNSIPTNPGIIPPTVTPRPLPLNIEDGVKWLMTNQKTDGSWMELAQTVKRDTAEAVFAIKDFAIAQQNYSLGFQWLSRDESENVDYLSRKLETLVNRGQDASALMNEILSRQNADGGWGSNRDYLSNPLDTALALKAIALAGYSDTTVVSKAITYVRAVQNGDGGWGGEDGVSTVEATADVLTAFSKYRQNNQIEDLITKGVTLLTQRQNPDGGFGNSPSTVYDTALAVMALKGLNASQDSLNNGITYLLNSQSGDGSWNKSPYQTALAIDVAGKVLVDPDLSIKTADITFVPATITSLPANIVVNAVVHNLGMTDIPQATVALYDGAVADANKIGVQTAAFPAQSSVTVTFPLTISDGNQHTFHVVTDPGNIIKEWNKANNVAMVILNLQGTYDFEVLSSGISLSQNPADIFSDVTISEKIRNKGTLNAYNVQVKYYIDDPQSPIDIGTTTIDIPAGASVTNQVTWMANKAGDNMPLTILVDPLNTFTEVSKENNKAVIPLTVRSSMDPNLTVSYKDITITPNPANDGGNAHISAIVANNGFSSASNIKVNFYNGTPGVDGVLIGSQTIPALKAGDSATVVTDWTSISGAGTKIVYVQVDLDNVIKEIKKDDNSAFTTLKVLSLPDLTITSGSIVFSPPAPKDGDIVSITATIRNIGEQGASNVLLTAYEGTSVIGSQTTASIAGDSAATATFSYDTSLKSGPHQITVVVDPNNTITEQSKDNNSASRSFGVQNADLWLTEQYISPNGDGVKDNMQFFFRLNAAQTVKVIVVNKKGEIVRTFSGNDLQNTAASSVTWDGLNDDGMVVDDGQYQITVVNGNGASLGSLNVTVDNNRSPLSDAIGTKYLRNNNLTCMRPDLGCWQWLPDESGSVFLVEWPSSNAPEYPTGFYTMAPDGGDITRLVPKEWTQGLDPTYDYYYENYALSPDGAKIALLLNKVNRQWGSTEGTQLWTVDRDTQDLIQIDSGRSSYGADVKWAPDSQRLVYSFYSQDTYRTDLWLVNKDGAGKIKIDSGLAWIDLQWLSWPDNGRNMVYAYYDLDAKGNYVPRMRASDPSGNRRDISLSPLIRGDIGSADWMTNQKVVLSAYDSNTGDSNLWLIDTTEGGNPKRLTASLNTFSLSPGRNLVAYAEPYRQSRTARLTVADTAANVYYSHDFTSGYCYSAIDQITWSRDGKKVAYIEKGGCGDARQAVPLLMVVDLASLKEVSIALQHPDSMDWLPDGVHIVLGDSNDKIFVVNSETAEVAQIYGSPQGSGSLLASVSPLGDEITYEEPVDPSSACYGRASADLWAISSLMNLTADLRATKDKSAVVLSGTAADLNFESFRIDYADANSPTLWNLISPPSSVPVLDDTFTMWVPPHEGTFLVKLTVSDKAGNVKENIKRVSWGLSTSITNLYKSADIFSPNGDGLKDSVNLSYTVVEPVHLEFTIYDGSDNLVRKIHKDYSAYTLDSMTWDGKDESGKIVADGKYKIKVFSYEFFVEVDTTPPDASVAIRNIRQLLHCDQGSSEMSVNVMGHVFDKNLKNWVIEYGEGDNPQQWYSLQSGSNQVVASDADGKPILNPAQDAVITTFNDDSIGMLVGKTLRIKGEDLAGNRKTVTSRFPEETLYILHVDVEPVFLFDACPGGALNAVTLKSSGTHGIGVLNTIRLPITSMNVQYSYGGQWIDTPAVDNPQPGEISLTWNDSGLHMTKIGGMRIRAVDVLGQEHYSNVVTFTESFGINCDKNGNAYGTNSLFEDLTSLEFQVKSDRSPQYSAWDSRYADWTKYASFDTAKRDRVPRGNFPLPLPYIQAGFHYLIKMIGVGTSETSYAAQGGYPCVQEWGIDLSVGYPEADCGNVSRKASLGATINGAISNASLKTLKYYMDGQDGSVRLLGQFDLTSETYGAVTVDTAAMPEGNYPVRAVLSYLDSDDNTVKEVSAQNSITVDRALPSAKITYPAPSASICAIKISDLSGSWLGIPIEGAISDNISVNKYQLFYGAGTSPIVWTPASTRRGKVGDLMIGYGSRQGRLGVWDVTESVNSGLSADGEFSIRLKVVDEAGNMGCAFQSFSIDRPVEAVLGEDKAVFSPNGDGYFDDVIVSWGLSKAANIDVMVFGLTQERDGSYTLGPTPIRTIASSLRSAGGSNSMSWDGKDDSSGVVPDGPYALMVVANDSCGNTTQKWIRVEVDNTSPTAVISYPNFGGPSGNIIDVRGTADDPHFKGYILEAGQGDNPDTWITVSSNIVPVRDNVLGSWNTFGLNGRWTLRLTATDSIENKNVVMVTVDLTQRKTLVKDLSATPRFFSPNNDGVLDTAAVGYSLTDSCLVEIDMLDAAGSPRKIYAFATPLSGANALSWDGKDSTGTTVPEGVYTVKLHAALSSNPAVVEDESITVIVDTSPPATAVAQPLMNSYFRDDVPVNGTITDANLLEYSVNLTGDGGMAVFDHGNQNRENYAFGVMSGLNEGNYTLGVTATDLAGNKAEKNISFTIDRTAPKVMIAAPSAGELYGTNKNVITVAGSIVERNLDSFSLRYGLGDNPQQWTELLGGNTLPASSPLFTWKVGKSDGIPDGFYTISLFAKDKVELTGEARVKVIVDNNPPDVSITFPPDGGYVTKPVDIRGTAFDPNLDGYTVEFSEARCASAFKWGSLKTSTAAVKDEVLASWQFLPPDGDYCIRLTATDKAGNKSDTKVTVRVDTHPPAPPVLSGTVESGSGSRLTWTKNTEPDLSGYNLYRDGGKLNTAVIKDLSYLDAGLKDGLYVYTVTAVDLAGDESKPSNDVKLRIGLTPPDAKMSSPQDGSRVSGLVDIKGTAYSSTDFKQYRVSVGQGAAPSSWNVLRTSPVPISYGLLAQWSTLGLSEGVYSLKLEAENLAGNVNTQLVSVTVDNTSPAPPVLISAIANGSDVTVTWKADGESDLVGYLLYRNGQIANAKGIVVGDLKPYLLNVAAYLDKGVPDGKFRYHLTAMDQAGNMSGQSNVIEVNIDTHPPHMIIGDPPDGTKFQNKILIIANTADLDIAAVQFQYKKALDSAWTNFGAVLGKAPYSVYLDPAALGLAYGNYNVRAIATDLGGKTDPSPTAITLTYAVLTPPDGPKGLTAHADGSTVTLTWTANTENDLKGYTVYRTSGATTAKAGTVDAPSVTYQDRGLADGFYAYIITATNTSSFESKPSNKADAHVYAPVLGQPYTPTKEKTLKVQGSDAPASSVVEVFNETSQGSASGGMVNADAQGNFTFAAASLTLGENRITVKATDSAGNRSRASDPVVVVSDDPPAAPTGFTASVNAFDVGFAWSANTESNLSGYNLYRNGTKVNADSAIVPSNMTASSSDPYNPPSHAIDGDPGTYWSSPFGNGVFEPLCFEVDLPSPELITHIDLHWGPPWDQAGNLYAGRDFEVQVWSGYAWITQGSVKGNAEKDNSFDFGPSYRTDKIRIAISDTTDAYYSKQVWLSEISILKENPITETQYQDTNLHDGNYNYTLTAVDYYGFESPPSAAQAAVGDVTPPATPQNLIAKATASSVGLIWSPNTEKDLAGYYVYRMTSRGWTKMNSSLLLSATYTDSNLTNGTYTYQVTAEDKTGNESLPSHEASAQVEMAPPQPPQNLKVSTVPAGASLSLSWVYPGGLASSFNVYRGTTQGGPYAKVGASSSGSTSYLDTGLKNGVTYWFVATAVDGVGNESAYSSEARGTPVDTNAPSKPVLSFPALQGVPATLAGGSTEISGSSEPASTVELFRNGIAVAQAVALENDAFQEFPGGDISDVSLSPDGKSLVYCQNSSVWTKNLAAGSPVQIDSQGYNPVWSPDGKTIAYIGYDASGSHIRLYDVNTAVSSPLTGDASLYEYAQSWSQDGSMISFITGDANSQAVRIKDLALGSIIEVAAGDSYGNQKISRDGLSVAYFDSRGLSLFDSVTGQSVLVDSQTDGYSLDWSPDSKRLAYVTTGNGNSDVALVGRETKKVTRLTSLAVDELTPLWSPDGALILFTRYETNGSLSLWIIAADSSGDAMLLKQGLLRLDNPAWAREGAISYIGDQGAVTVAYLRGHFSFDSVKLEPGENSFTASATDRSGNQGPTSDAVSVVYDTSLLPDLVVTEEDITIYPPYPVVGQTGLVTATVRNAATGDGSNVTVNGYLWDSQGNVSLLKSDIISSIPAGSSRSISFNLDTAGRSGEIKIVVAADPTNAIIERDKTNNVAIKKFSVAEKEGIAMSTTLDSDQYTSSRDVKILVDIKNSGIDKDATITTLIEDAGGHQVTLFDKRTLRLPYASSQVYSLLWNSGPTYAGPYRVHTSLTDGTSVIAENIVPFTILPDINLDSSLVTNKTVYGSKEDVLIGVSIKNNGKNYVIPDLKATMKVSDASGNVLFAEDKSIANLLPGALATLSSTWNTGLSLPGDYSASVDIYISDKRILSTSGSFKISGSSVITGSVAVTPAVVIYGNTAEADYAVQNIGNADVSGMSINLLITDLETQTILASHHESFDLLKNGAKSGKATFPTQGYALKTYGAVLQYIHQGTTKTVATTSFAVKDGTPPLVSINSPRAGNSYNAKFDISVTATDDASGVDRVEYQIDKGAWSVLPVSNPSGGRYKTTWAPTSADNGTHSIGFRATDEAGNTSQPFSITITIDVNNAPPTGSVTINNGAAYTTTTAVTLSLNATGTGGGVAKMCLSNTSACTAWEDYAPIKAWTLSSGDGNKTVYVWYEDSLGASNTTPHSASIILDATSPVLTVSTLADGSWTRNQLLNVSGKATDDNGIQQLTVNGTVVTIDTDGTFSYALTLQDVLNTVVVTATDLAGNQTKDTRTINLDRTAPMIIIATPPDNLKTKQPSVDITGAVDEQSTVVVSINGSDPVPAVMDSIAFTLSVPLTYGINTIEVTAKDRADNRSTEKRTVTFDDQNPSLSVTEPPQDIVTNRATIMIKGQTSDLTTVAVTITTDGNVYKPDVTSGQFQEFVTFPTEKTYQIYVRGVDEAGNETIVQRNVIYDIRPPSVTIDPVTSPIDKTSQTLTGTVEAGATVNVACQTASVGAVNYPTPTAWSVTVANMAEGDNNITVTASDAAGNTSSNIPACIVVDTSPPVTTITGKPNNPTDNTSASFSFTSNEAASTFQCQLDGGSDSACASQMNYVSLTDGPHTFSVKATDAAGNQEVTPANYAWTIDTTPPASSITTPSGGPTMMGAMITVTGTAFDAGISVQKVEVSTDGGATWNIATGATAWSYGWAVPADGIYTIMSRATDSAGNVEVPGTGITVMVYKREPTSVATSGRQLLVNGDPFTIKGVVYSPVPIGDDPEAAPPYGDYFTSTKKSIYSRDLPLLRQMGANTLRLWTWDRTADHHEFLDSAYNGGVTPIYIIAGYWINPGFDIDPQSPNNVRQQLKANFRAMVAAHKYHPAILMWAIGNDLNAALMYGGKLSNLFSLINEMAAEAHAEEGSMFHPVTVALADRSLISTISAYDAALPSIDVWGANVYRGNTFGTLFKDFKASSSKPLAILEYGIDAFDNTNGDEYENIGTPYQATYAEALWNEIKANSDVCIGGSIMEYSDEWWKGKHSTDPGCPDNNSALQSSCGYAMSPSPDGYDNEEWWGIMRTKAGSSGQDTTETRVLYYALQELWVPSTNAPHVSVSPNAANFGGLAVGGSSQAQTLSISNRGMEDLAIGAITISGTDASEFIRQKDSCSGHTLIPSKTCTLQVVFSPTSTGSKSATLSIPSGDPATPSVSVTLSGTATASISGSVTSGGSPLSGVTMTLSGGTSATTTTDLSGNYAFTGLVNGSYTVTPSKTDYTFTPTSSSLNMSGGNVTGRNFTGTMLTFTITPSAGTGGAISPWTPQTVSYNETVSFIVTANAGYHVVSVSVDGVSQGPLSSYTFTNVTANHTISATFARNFGVFGVTGVNISAGYVDSYDSSKGSYSGVHGLNGSVGTNSVANGAINLSGGALVYGDVLVGPGGNQTKAIVTSGGSIIYGSKGALNSAKSMTPVTDPGGGTSTSFTNGATLTSGTYRVSAINLSGSGMGAINGNVTLYVTGNMTVSGSAQIVIPQGSSLTLYVSGSISVSGGGIVNKNLNPHTLTIYGTSTCTSASYSGGSAFYGVIYTPKANTSISGGSSIYGSIIGGSITISGGSAVHYDESLGDIGR